MGDDVRGGTGRDDSGNPRRLTQDGRPTGKAGWSPDGPQRRPHSDGGRGKRDDERFERGPASHEKVEWVRDDAPSPPPAKKKKRRASAPIDIDLVHAELARALPPAKAKRLSERVAEAATCFANEQLDDARRILKPIAEEAPSAASVRELLGLTLYQLGRWRPAATELEAFRELTDALDQNPVLADCYRAVGRHTDAEELWEELRQASPSAELVAEGRIVAAGSLADRGLLADAIRLLESAPRGKKAREHHLRTAYALADLRERAGDVSRARELFAWVAGVDDGFADVRQRLSALS